MRKLDQAREAVDKYRRLEDEVRDLEQLTAIARDERDEKVAQDIATELRKLEDEVRGIEFEVALSGPYDERGALLSIHAGAGGTDSQDWAQMLLHMYLRWAEKRGYKTDVVSISPGEEAGIKSADISISGRYAYGYLKSERGVHRLVRLSPFDFDHARHTSFALVEVMPESEDAVEVNLSPEDLKIETFLSSGPGGQHMQKTSSAVRITHLPTSIVVTCQSERSQHHNKEVALKILYSRLLQREITRQEEEMARLKGKHVTPAWGNQIRSYVLHPYQMVKDHRTGYETSDTQGVLEGALDDFIMAYIEQGLGRENA